jgi:hypothetical protein
MLSYCYVHLVFLVFKSNCLLGLSGPIVELVPGSAVVFGPKRQVNFWVVDETSPWRPFVQPHPVIGSRPPGTGRCSTLSPHDVCCGFV